MPVGASGGRQLGDGWPESMPSPSTLWPMQDLVNASDAPAQILQIVAVAVLAIIVNSALGFTLQHVIRRAVRRAVRGKGRWRVRLPRTHEVPPAHTRRIQRADATAKMITRLATLFIIAAATLVISHIVGVDPLVLISSAGFIGAAIAIGGQSVIKDWLTGLMVLLEDRYADGDDVVLSVAGRDVEGTVASINSTSVRLQLADDSMLHVGHGSIETVNNRSQRKLVGPPNLAIRPEGIHS